MNSRSNSAVYSNLRRVPVDAERMRVFGANGNSDFQAIALPTSYLNSGTQSTMNSQTIPPPLPPRPTASRYGNRYSSYNSMYSSPYSRYSPGLYSSAYGSYRTPYNSYGMPPDSYNSFAQLAEESTRPAFESIESVVDIVGSISMMLESTYHAVYSSYNAILGVVDQFSRLRDHLYEVISFLALLRGLRYLCLKVLYLLRLKKDNPSVEAAWKTARSASEHSDFSQFHNDKKSPWPFFMFVGLVVGAPWLIFKLLARSVANRPFDKNMWKDKGGYFTCTANYDFVSSRRGELSFRAGESLYIAPKHLQANAPRGWFLACNNDNKIGLIPGNYLRTQQPSAVTRRVKLQKIPKTANATDQPSEVLSEKPVETEINFPEDSFPSFDDDTISPEIIPFPPVVKQEPSGEKNEK